MADVGSAVFRAIADFSRIRREARKTARGLGDLRDETRDADRALDDLAEQADDTGDEIHQLGEKAETSERKTRGWARQLVQAAARLTLLTAGVNRLHRAMRSPVLVTYALRLRAVGRAAQAAYDDLDRFRRLVDSLHRRSGRLIPILAKLTAGLAALSVVSTGLVAGAGGILSLVAAIGALSGALGLIPAGIGLFAAGIGVLTVGMQGFGDALSAITEGDLEAFEEAIKNLAPSAQLTARALWALRPAFKALRLAVQGRLFAGMAEQVRRLAAVYLPLLKRTLVGVAGAINQAGRDVGDFLAQARQIADIDRFLANTERSAWRLVPAAENLTAAFLDLALVGSELLPQFADEFADMTGRFRVFMREARDSGRLAEWIADGVEQLKLLGSIAKSTGGILHSIFTAGEEAGYSFLRTVDKAMDRLNRFLASAKGQEGLRSLFKAAAEAGEALAPVLEELFRTLTLDIAPILSEMGQRIAPGLEDAIAGLGDAFENAEPGLLKLADAVGRFLSALGENGPLIGEIAEGVTRVLVPALHALAFILETLAGWFNSLPEPVQNLVGSLAGAVVVAGVLFFAFGKLISALKTAKQTWKALNLVVDAFRRKARRAAAARAAGAAAGGGTTVVAGPDVGQSRRKGEAAGTAARKGFLAKFGRGLKGGIGLILQGALLGLAFFPGAVGKIATKAKGAFTGGFKGTAPAATGIMGRVGAAIRGVGPAALAVASKLKWLRLAFSVTPWGLAINGLILAGTLVWTHWDSVVAGVKSAWNGTVAFFRGLGPRIQGAWTTTTTWMAGLPGQAQRAVGGMGAWFDKLPGRLGYAAGYAGGWVVREIGQMRRGTVTHTAALYVRVTDWFSKLPGRLGNLARQTGSGVKNWFRDMKTRTVADTAALLVGAGNWFSKLPGRLGGAARSAGSATKNAFRDMKNRAVADTAALGIRTVDIVRGLPGKIKNFASDFWAAGRDLATGLWQGIQSAASKVVATTVSMVVRAIQGAKAAARSGSPSRVFMALGFDIDEGLALGIERMAGRVFGAVRGLIDRLRGLFSGGLVPQVQTGMQRAAAEILAAMRAGKTVFEDLSFRGMSANAKRFNDQLAKAFHAGGNAFNRRDVSRFLAARSAPTGRNAAVAPSVGPLLAAALPDIGRAGMVRAEDGSWVPPSFYSQTSANYDRGVTVNFGDIVNPVPEPASDTAARKLRTLALMGAFG